MRARKPSYTTYSIGVGIAWAVRLVLAWAFEPADKRRRTVLVFLGFVLGWVSATIARQVYPPPARYRQKTDTSP